MFRKLVFIAALPLVSCAWAPVLTPYAYGQRTPAPASETATVWGVADGTTMYFRKVNGDGLPSRGGGGYPVSLSLRPGSYVVEVHFSHVDNRYATIDLPVTVEAGHTYVVEHVISASNTHVGLNLKDLGASATCHHDRYNEFRGNAKLVCQ